MRRLIGFSGVLMAAFPDVFVKGFQWLAMQHPDRSRPKPWLARYIRLEGLAAILLSIEGDRWYRLLLRLCAVFGMVAMITPRRYLHVGAKYAFEDSDEVEWRAGLFPIVRAIGGFVAVLALRSLSRRNT